MSLHMRSRAFGMLRNATLALFCLSLSGCLMRGRVGHGGDEGWPIGLIFVALLCLLLWVVARKR